MPMARWLAAHTLITKALSSSCHREGKLPLHRTIEIADEPGLIRYRLGPSKLYIDDVRLIYEHLVDDSKARTRESGEEAAPVVITAGKATADLPEDLSEATPKELQTVRVALDRPLVTVDLWRRGAGVTAQSSDPRATALARGIRDNVNSKRSLLGIKVFKSSADGLLIALIIVVCMTIISPLSYSMHAPHVWLINSGSAVGLFMFTILGRSFFLYLSGTIKVVPRKQNEVRGLTSETRKQLFIALAGAIVGGLIVGLAGLWAGGAIHH